jgi:hypothetical protein
MHRASTFTHSERTTRHEHQLAAGVDASVSVSNARTLAIVVADAKIANLATSSRASTAG